jgi:hypothetical protein
MEPVRRFRLVNVRALRIAGIICLVLGLFLYYSHKSVTVPVGGVPRPKSPVEGPTPVRSTRTVFTIDLPFSPIYAHQWDERMTPIAAKSSAPQGSTTIKLKDMVVSGDVSSVQATVAKSHRIEFFCWSTALAIVGLGLLIASFIPGESHVRDRAL